jgi:hypothetical protein
LGLGDFDILDIYGDAYFNSGILEFDFINGFDAVAGDYWDFLFADTITGWDTLSFTFNNLDAGLDWSFAQLDTGGKRLLIESEIVASAPEPGTYTLILTGLGLLSFATWRKKVLLI